MLVANELQTVIRANRTVRDRRTGSRRGSPAPLLSCCCFVLPQSTPPLSLSPAEISIRLQPQQSKVLVLQLCLLFPIRGKLGQSLESVRIGLATFERMYLDVALHCLLL